jgi:hypothetical protein
MRWYTWKDEHEKVSLARQGDLLVTEVMNGYDRQQF